jgi:hypothetical protein
VKTDKTEYPTGQKACERYDLATGKWSKAAPLPFEMERPRGLRLRDGRVLAVASGTGWAIYDPAKDAWTAKAETDNVRCCFAELPDGRVVLFGTEDAYTRREVSILDPQSGKVTKTKNGTRLPRNDGLTFTLDDGAVMLVGGDLYNNIAVEPEVWTESAGGAALPGLERALERQVKARAKYDAKEKEAKKR